MLKIQVNNNFEFLKINFSQFFKDEKEFEDIFNQLSELKSQKSYLESLDFEKTSNRPNFHYLIY